MSDFRCEWQALHGPRCSHQCNECKDNDTPPEPRMTSERQETEQAFERWYNHAFATRGVDTKHMNDCEDAFEAGRTLALRATPRAVPDETRTFGAGTIPRFVDVVCAGPPGPSAGRFVECDDEAGKSVSAGEWQERPDGLWALRIYLNPSPAAGHAVPDETLEAVAFTASAGTCRRCKSRVRMGGPAPDSCTNCAAPAESHPPRAVPASGERQAVEPLCERLSRAALNQRDTGQHHAADDLDAACAVIRALASPAVAPDEPAMQEFRCIRPDGSVSAWRTPTGGESRDEAVARLRARLPDWRFEARDLYAHPPGAGEVTEAVDRVMQGYADAYPTDVWPEVPFTDAQAASVMRLMVPRIREALTAALGRPS